MPSKQSKKVFIGGLDRDLDPRFLKDGDYHHSLNLRNMGSESNTQGLLENIKGTQGVDFEFFQFGVSGKRKLCLFIPSDLYWKNYGPSDGSGYGNPQSFTGQPISVAEGFLEYNDILSFNIAYGSSLSEIQNPTQLFEIAYRGDTVDHQLNYLTFFKDYYQSQFNNLGVNVEVINNNHPDFDNDYFFGQAILENITNDPDYSPGQIYAYALLFTAGIQDSEPMFYIDLLGFESAQPMWIGVSDTITGTLFTDINLVWLSPQTITIGDSFGYNPEELGFTDDYSSDLETNQTNIFLTEHLDGIETCGWSIGPDGHWTLNANAVITMEEDAGTGGPLIEYTTIGTYEDTENDKIYWMVASSSNYHYILEYDLLTNLINIVFRDVGSDGNVSGVFGWRPYLLINDINKVGDVLYWTSRQYGEPCSINVRKSINSMILIDSQGTNSNQNGLAYILNEEGGTDNISLEDYYPFSFYDVNEPRENKLQYVEVIKRLPIYSPTYVFNDDTNYTKNNLFGNMWQFRYRYHFYDNEVSAWSPISDVIPSLHDKNNYTQVNATPFEDNQIDISVKNSSGIVKFIEICGRKCKDLGNIPKGNRGEFFTIAKINNDFSAWQINKLSEQVVSFYNDQLYPFVDAGEGDRLFDAVPRSAHTQTIMSNNRLAYGNYTEGFNVPNINIGFTTQYGYVQGDSSKPYGGTSYVDPVDSGIFGGGVSAFKSGAFHSFGIVYYGKRGRCSTVLTDNNSQVYVKFPTERVDSDIPTNFTGDLYGAATISWEINHKAPDWAVNYRWFYSRNTTVDEFIQFRVKQAYINNFTTSDNRIFISLRGLKGADDSYITSNLLVDSINQDNTPNPNTEVWDYDFVKGDRIRFITSGNSTSTSTTATNVATSYIDVRIAGFEFYSQADPTIPIQNASGNNALPTTGLEDGWFVIIEEVLDSNGSPVAGYSELSNANIGGSIAEIYRTKQEPSPEETIYYEFSELYEIDTYNSTIAASDIPNGVHLGPIANQGNIFTEDAFGNFTSNTPATGQFTTGDIYYKKRTMQDMTGTGKTDFYVEDYFLNDYTNTNHFSIGRANISSPYYKQHDKEVSITYSDVYSPSSSFNGLSTFDNNLGNWKDYSEIDATIQKIFARDGNMVVIHEDKTYNIPIDKNILNSADGKNSNVSLSSNVLGPMQPYPQHYGISKNPESFVSNGNVLYWVDIRRGAVLRLKENSITNIAQAKMLDFFRDQSEDYRTFNPQLNWELDYGNFKNYMFNVFTSKFRIKGGYNPKHGEYIVQLPSISRRGEDWSNLVSIYDKEISTWENLLDNTTIILQDGVPFGEPYKDIIKTTGGVLAWSETQQRWITTYSHIADYYGKINILFTSWKGGSLYLHDQDEDNYNTFYGITYNTELDFYINESPSSVKGFKSITLEANQELSMVNYLSLENIFSINNLGIVEDQVEETEKTSYDITLVTDMTETSINRNNFDQRENKQYAMIPFVTKNSTGSEIIGIGSGTVETGALQTVTGFQTTFGSSSLILGTSSDVTSSNYGDQLFYNDGTSDILVGTISDLNSDTELTLAADAVPFVPVGSKFLFVKRSGFAEGDRMKGRFMEVKMKKRSKKLLEIFSGSATIFNSELSDD